MAKTKKTARELAAMVMREVGASGKCSDLQSVVVHPTGRNYPTWECATQVNKPDNPNYQLSAACRHTLDLIVGRLPIGVPKISGIPVKIFSPVPSQSLHIRRVRRTRSVLFHPQQHRANPAREIARFPFAKIVEPPSAGFAE